MSVDRYAVVETSLGEITIVALKDAIIGLYFPRHWHLPNDKTFGQQVSLCGDQLLGEAARQLLDYFGGNRTHFDLPLVTSGDPFQERVWALLAQVPFGRTTTYGGLAAQLGDRAMAQHVGQAVAHNRLCVFIPCHRVIGADGRLAGYAGGVHRKRALLALEQRDADCVDTLF